MRSALLVLALLFANVARADDFGGWTFTPPVGAKKTTRSTQETGDHVTLTKLAGRTFCQYVVFATHAQATNDQQFEWENVEDARWQTSHLFTARRFRIEAQLRALDRRNPRRVHPGPDQHRPGGEENDGGDDRDAHPRAVSRLHL
jgi:hypothetical protein